MGRQHALVDPPADNSSVGDELVKDKLDEAKRLLLEAGAHFWLVVSPGGRDPSIPLVVGGTPVSQRGVFLISALAGNYAAVSSHDLAEIRRTGGYDVVVPYVGDLRQATIELLELANATGATVAVNDDAYDPAWGGLSYGRHEWLSSILDEIGCSGRLVSARPILSQLRAVKTQEEIRRITQAAKITQQIFDGLQSYLSLGMSELEIRDFFFEGARKRGVEAWAIVGFGGKGYTTHREPSNRVARAGDQLMIDGGVRFEGYLADMSRTFYFPRQGEGQIPQDLLKLSEVHLAARESALEMMRPGTRGWQLDEVARKAIRDAGYPEYEHALGHQIGRLGHDGGTLLGPKWEIYGRMPYGQLMAGEVYTLEPTIITGEGLVCQIEEEFLVTPQGPEPLVKRQRGMICLEA